MSTRISTDDSVHIQLTPAQARRLAKVTQAAAATMAVRDEVLSAIIEGVMDRDFSGWKIQILETEIVLTAPGSETNGATPLAPADVMSP